jgi:hypothetical protein
LRGIAERKKRKHKNGEVEKIEDDQEEFNSICIFLFFFSY